MKNYFQIIGHIGSNIQMNKGTDKESATALPDMDKQVKSHTILSIASNNNYKDKAGEWQQKTYWNDVNLFGEIASRVFKTYSNGSLILIEGSLSKIKFEDKDGITRHSTSLIGKSIRLLKASDDSKNSKKSQYKDEGKINSEETR